MTVLSGSSDSPVTDEDIRALRIRAVVLRDLPVTRCVVQGERGPVVKDAVSVFPGRGALAQAQAARDAVAAVEVAVFELTGEPAVKRTCPACDGRRGWLHRCSLGDRSRGPAKVARSPEEKAIRSARARAKRAADRAQVGGGS